MPNDRDKVKWAPFNSVINNKDVLRELSAKKDLVNKPILSEDQIIELENLITESYYNQTPIEVIFYKNKQFYKIDGIITNIDSINKKITINSHNSYYFSNIIKIIIKNT